MTTTTTTTPATLATPATRKRPTVLVVAAALMVLAAVLSLASPFIPRGFGGAGGPGGALPANGQAPSGAGQFSDNGQAPGGTGQFPGNGQAPGGGGQPPANGQQGFGPGGAGGFPGVGGIQTGGSFSVMNLMQPLRIGGVIVGALFALLAALGLWRLRIWGRTLALIVAVAALLSVAVAFISPALGPSPWLMVLGGSTWQSIAGFALAVTASILALLPVARRAYIVRPRERRVA